MKVTEYKYQPLNDNQRHIISRRSFMVFGQNDYGMPSSNYFVHEGLIAGFFTTKNHTLIGTTEKAITYTDDVKFLIDNGICTVCDIAEEVTTYKIDKILFEPYFELATHFVRTIPAICCQRLIVAKGSIRELPAKSEIRTVQVDCPDFNLRTLADSKITHSIILNDNLRSPDMNRYINSLNRRIRKRIQYQSSLIKELDITP